MKYLVDSLIHFRAATFTRDQDDQKKHGVLLKHANLTYTRSIAKFYAFTMPWKVTNLPLLFHQNVAGY